MFWGVKDIKKPDANCNSHQATNQSSIDKVTEIISNRTVIRDKHVTAFVVQDILGNQKSIEVPNDMMETIILGLDMDIHRRMNTDKVTFKEGWFQIYAEHCISNGEFI